MASVTFVDRSLSRTSSWMSYVAFIGLIALAFLPARGPEHGAAARKLQAAAAAQAAVQSAPAPAKAPPTPATAPAAAPAPAPGGEGAAPGTLPPPPDAWTPAELAAGLRKCVQLLAPAAAEIDIEEPMKHGQCGTPVPLVLHSVGGTEKVEFSPPPTLNCRLAASLAEWVEKVLQPAAQQVLGSRIKRIVGSSSYSCRNIYNNPKLSLSEHATGNAIDIGGFVTTDGRTVMVSRAWGPTERDIAEAKKKAEEKQAAKNGGKSGGAEPVKAEPTPSIEDAGKKSEAKEKGRLVKAHFKPGEAKAAETKAGETKPAEAKAGETKAGETKAEAKSADTKGAEAKAGETKGEDAKPTPAHSPLPVPATSKEAAFLKRLHGGSCAVFATVLGPEANEAHRDHFHLDMKVRQNSGTVCH